MQLRVKQRLGRVGQPGETDPARAALQMGRRSQECGESFGIRKKIADEWQDHCPFILSAPQGDIRPPIAPGYKSICSRRVGTRTGPRSRL